MPTTADLFRDRLGRVSDLGHPLAVWANPLPWRYIEASLADRFAPQVRADK